MFPSIWSDTSFRFNFEDRLQYRIQSRGLNTLFNWNQGPFDVRRWNRKLRDSRTPGKVSAATVIASISLPRLSGKVTSGLKFRLHSTDCFPSSQRLPASLRGDPFPLTDDTLLREQAFLPKPPEKLKIPLFSPRISPLHCIFEKQFGKLY